MPKLSNVLVNLAEKISDDASFDTDVEATFVITKFKNNTCRIFPWTETEKPIERINCILDGMFDDAKINVLVEELFSIRNYSEEEYIHTVMYILANYQIDMKPVFEIIDKINSSFEYEEENDEDFFFDVKEPENDITA